MSGASVSLLFWAGPIKKGIRYSPVEGLHSAPGGVLQTNGFIHHQTRNIVTRVHIGNALAVWPNRYGDDITDLQLRPNDVTYERFRFAEQLIKTAEQDVLFVAAVDPPTQCARSIAFDDIEGLDHSVYGFTGDDLAGSGENEVRFGRNVDCGFESYEFDVKGGNGIG